MKTLPESKVFAELRAIREQIYEEAMKVGVDRYYEELNRRAGFFLGKLPVRRKKLSARARATKRRQCVAKLPEPACIKEIHAIRQQMQAEEKRVGSEKYWAEVNKRAKQFARRHGLKYVESPSRAAVVRERPAKDKAR